MVDPVALMKIEEKRKAVEAEEQRKNVKKQLGKSITERLPPTVQKGKALGLVFYPDDKLSVPCDLVENISSDTREICRDMLFTMYVCGGIGLSAPQVGIKEKIFVADWSEKKDRPVIVVNPEVLEVGKDQVSVIEGCLSFPSVRFPVSRSISVRAHWYNDVGREYDQWLEGWAARVFLHEYDHLYGKTFLDRVSPVVRRQALKKMNKLHLRLERDMKKGRKRFQRRNWR